MLRRRTCTVPALCLLALLAGACSDQKTPDLLAPTHQLDLVPDADDDGDGILNQSDNCPTTPNPDQADADGDAIGDRCDSFPNDPTNADADGDAVGDATDNCPAVPNPDQQNMDGDPYGDACDPFPDDPTNRDLDGDGYFDDVDNCPQIPNKQEDADGDGVGDVCDKYPNDPMNHDTDNDGFSDSFDNCPTVAQKNQLDADRDGAGDACDNDRDGDGWDNKGDNCPDYVNVDQADSDKNGVGDACQGIKPVIGPPGDFDGDGVRDADDNCPAVANKDQSNLDGDKLGDVCDPTPFPNSAPVITALRLPAAPVPVGTAVTIQVDFTDPDAADAHVTAINWEAATTNPVVPNGARSYTDSYTFTEAGVYTVSVLVQDRAGASDTHSSTVELPAYIVVYDPSAGFVTGGGWINSPAGACATSVCTSATTGKANFGFVSKYQKGATTPSGNTEFQFHAGDLRFKSTSYAWLVVAGNKAKYKGEGAINGGGRYGFMITAIDNSAGADQFRIKIWDAASGVVVYDNKMGSAEDSDDAMDIAAGSIVVHNR